MKITDILTGLTAIIYENDMKNPAARRSGNEKGEGKRANTTDKSAQTPGAVDDVVVGGEATSDEGRDAIDQASAKVASGAADKEIKSHKNKQAKQGAINPMYAYGDSSDSDNDAANAADDFWDSIGTPEEDHEDLDYRQNYDEDDVGDDENPRPHSDATVEEYVNSSNITQRAIGLAMQRANDEWDEERERELERERGTPLSASEKIIQAQNKKIKDERKRRWEAIPDKIKNAILKHQDVLKKNTQTYNDLPRIEKERVKSTGASRGSQEVTQNQDDVNSGKEGDENESLNTPAKMNAAAVRAQAGDEKATIAIFKNTGRLLQQIARKYGFDDSQISDMYAEAKIALLQAIKTYDPENDKKASFFTWLTNNVTNLVKNAAYENRNIRVDRNKMQLVAKYKFLLGKLQAEGIRGTDASLEIIKRMKLKSWDELEELKKNANMMNSTSMSTPIGGSEEGDVGELGDTLGHEGIESEYTAGGQAIGTGGADAYSDLEQMSKEMATSDEDTKIDLFHQLANESELNETEREVIYLAMGIGNNEQMSDSDIQTATGLTARAQKRAADSALEKMADTIAYDNDTNVEDELQNLQRIYADRKFDSRMSNVSREIEGYGKDTDEERSNRDSAKSYSNKKRAKDKQDRLKK